MRTNIANIQPLVHTHTHNLTGNGCNETENNRVNTAIILWREIFAWIIIIKTELFISFFLLHSIDCSISVLEQVNRAKVNASKDVERPDERANVRTYKLRTYAENPWNVIAFYLCMCNKHKTRITAMTTCKYTYTDTQRVNRNETKRKEWNVRSTTKKESETKRKTWADKIVWREWHGDTERRTCPTVCICENEGKLLNFFLSSFNGNQFISFGRSVVRVLVLTLVPPVSFNNQYTSLYTHTTHACGKTRREIVPFTFFTTNSTQQVHFNRATRQINK